MTERVVKVTLTLSASQYQAELEKAKKATETLGGTSEKVGAQGSGAMDKLAQSARNNREAWTTTGSALLVFGAAVTGIGIAALKTGIQYNTLQQTTRAALTSLLGSAEAANAQMDKLDAFARTSPFSKATFITAQQQMLAFGIEAKKVVPYLDAVQNAVAAAGGSNADIEGIVATMSKIQSSAKITAEDLNELGGRGVNAAELIGSQMGMTGAQVRDAITKGSLDAGVALDSLAAGMKQRFDGAADGVKNTFAGSMDRIKAAWRDLSADLASPLVGPTGGGFLVDLNNQIADAMRSFQSLPEPVKIATTAIAGLTGVGALAAGTFLTLAPRLIDTWDALGKMGRVGAGAQSALRGIGSAATGMLGPFGLAAAAVIAAVVALDQLSTMKPPTYSPEEFTGGLLDVRDAAFTSTAALDEFFTISSGGFRGFNATKEVKGFGDALNVVFNSGMNDRARDAMSWLPLIDNADFRGAREGIEGLDGALAGLVTSGEAATASEAWTLIVAQADALGISVDELKEKFPQYAAAVKDAENQQRILGGTTETTTGITKEQQKATEEAQKAYLKWQGVIAGGMSAFVDVGGAYQSVIDKNREVAESTAEATKSSKDDWQDYYDGVSVSAADWATKLEEHVGAMRNWRTNILTITAQVREQMPADMVAAADAMLDELIAKGPDGAAAIETFMTASPEEKARIVEAWRETSAGATAEFANELAAARGMEIPTELTVDTAPADLEMVNWYATTSGEVTTTQVAAKTDAAVKAVSDFFGVTAGTTTATKVDANTGLARSSVKTTTDWIALQNPSVTMGANDWSARSTVNATLGWTAQQSASISVKADTSTIGGSIAAAVSAAKARTGSITIPTSAGFAGGGGVHGAGTGTSDSIPAMLSNNEHVWTAAEVAAAGGHGEMYRWRAAVKAGRVAKFADGGGVGGYGQYMSMASFPSFAPAPQVNVSTPPIDYDRLAAVVLAGSQRVSDATLSAQHRSDLGTRTTAGVVR